MELYESITIAFYNECSLMLQFNLKWEKEGERDSERNVFIIYLLEQTFGQS